MKRLLFLLFFASLSLNSCKKDDPVAPSTRTYVMGMQNSAPRYDDFSLVLQTLALWVPRSDAAIITTEVPWDSLYAGKTPQQYVLNNYAGLVDYYRSINFKLWVYIDPANGLDRSADSDKLKALGKSITSAEVQGRYRRFVVVIDSMLKPEHLGLALETNLIRAASSDAIYQAVKKAANDAASDVRTAGSVAKLSVSVQADLAWGKVAGVDGTNYVGVAQDFVDFPFLQELGISSYPYFNFSQPEDIPSDYYSKLVEGKSLDVFVSEGGWSSESFEELNSTTTITSSPDLQRRYIKKQGELLANASATALFQLVFTDLDLSAIPDGVNPVIKYFAYLGLVDANLTPRPSLAAWDELFGLRLK